MIVRRELPADIDRVRAIHVAGFAQGDGVEPIEATLLDELRQCDGWIAKFSLVVLRDDLVIGHAVCTRGRVGNIEVLGLGPIAVMPEVQHRGAGLALMHSMIGAADAADVPLIALLGSIGYYSRFGFVRSTDLDIQPPEAEWGANFQVRTLSSFEPSISGTFEYAEPFQRL